MPSRLFFIKPYFFPSFVEVFTISITQGGKIKNCNKLASTIKYLRTNLRKRTLTPRDVNRVCPTVEVSLTENRKGASKNSGALSFTSRTKDTNMFWVNNVDCLYIVC